MIASIFCLVAIIASLFGAAHGETTFLNGFGNMDQFFTGDYIFSENGNFKMRFSPFGEICIFGPSSDWCSQIAQNSNSMQNIIFFSSDNCAMKIRPVDGDTYYFVEFPFHDCYMELQNNGDLVIYNIRDMSSPPELWERAWSCSTEWQCPTDPNTDIYAQKLVPRPIGPDPTLEPTPEPSLEPTLEPTREPSPEPTPAPSFQPTSIPSSMPSVFVKPASSSGALSYGGMVALYVVFLGAVPLSAVGYVVSTILAQAATSGPVQVLGMSLSKEHALVKFIQSFHKAPQPSYEKASSEPTTEGHAESHSVDVEMKSDNTMPASAL